MAHYVAEAALLNTPKECARCHCHTRSGHYVENSGGRVESLLFVCRDCYAQHYAAQSIEGAVREAAFSSDHSSSAWIGRAAAVFNRCLKRLRVMLVLILVLLIGAYCFKEQPAVRRDIVLPEIHRADPDFEGLQARWRRVRTQVQRIMIEHRGEWR